MSENTVTFYTQPTLLRSIVHSQLTGATATNYPYTHLQDRSLDTTWKPTSTATQTFLFDLYPQNTTEEAAAYLAGRGKVYHDATGTPPYFTTSGSSHNIDTFGIWLKNYQDFAVGGIGAINYAYRLTAAGDNGPNLLGQTWLNSGVNGLWYKDITASTTQRYVWVSIASLTGIPEVASVFFLKKRTIQTKPNFPIRFNRKYYTNIVKMLGGRRYISAQALNYTFVASQNYRFTSVINRDTYLNVFQDSYAGTLPIVYQEETDIEDAYVVQLMQNVTGETLINHEQWRAQLKMESLAYIKSGDRY